MVSKKTLEELMNVLKKHVPDMQGRNALLVDLYAIRGNRSFNDTVAGLLSLEHADESTSAQERP